MRWSCCFSAKPKAGRVNLTPLADAQMVAQRSAMRYDRDGDGHYDILSACKVNPRL